MSQDVKIEGETMTEQAVTIFNFGAHAVLVVSIEGESWWVATDVCGALGISNASDACSSLDAGDRRGIATADTHGTPQNFIVINEPGLYELIFRSRRPEARAFTRWVTHEVLPSIRKIFVMPGAQGALPLAQMTLAGAAIDFCKKYLESPHAEAVNAADYLCQQRFGERLLPSLGLS